MPVPTCSRVVERLRPGVYAAGSGAPGSVEGSESRLAEAWVTNDTVARVASQTTPAIRCRKSGL
eukprot:scaffold123816_cov34-Tisochrysis_lutea.AAC.3